MRRSTEETEMPSYDLDEPVLLFFREFEPDRFFKNDRYLFRPVRPVYRRLVGKPQTTGFSVWFKLLSVALRNYGCRLRINDTRYARRHPDAPVGLVGYPSLLDNWTLSNPAVLGPALFDHPAQAPNLMADPRFVSYVVTCDWMSDVFSPVYGAAVGKWFAGIDLDEWPDTSGHAKEFDVLIYDKVRWNRDHYQETLITPIERELARRGLATVTIRYGRYHHAQYRDALARSRVMVFLCEHETQGMAYQEALASNVPVLAWDQGEWLDPVRPNYSEVPIAATSVPYFDDRCGARFRGAGEFPDALTSVLDRSAELAPREFVADRLSQRASAEAYLDLLRRARR